MCHLLNSATNYRFYYRNDHFVIIENLTTTTPMLLASKHGNQKIPFDAFIQLKKIASKLFGNNYCLAPSLVDADHFCIKVVKLVSA